MAWLKGPRGTGNYIEVNEDVRFMKDVQNVGQNLIGDTYYVRNDGDDGKSGKNVSEAFKTLEYAVHHAAEDWDKIIVLTPDDSSYYLVEAVQGVDDDNKPITITQRGLKIYGDQTSWMTYGSPLIHSHVTQTDNAPILAIGADDVEIAYLTIRAQGTNMSCIRAGDGGEANRVHIHHCCFMGMGTTGTYGVMTGAGAGGGHAAPYPTIDHCRFTDFPASAIFMNGQDGASIKNCIFDNIPAAGFGIECSSTTLLWVPMGIYDNRFSGEDNTDTAAGSTGIKNPASMAGKMSIDGNSFMYFGLSRAIVNETHGVCGVNYLNGVLLVDDAE